MPIWIYPFQNRGLLHSINGINYILSAILLFSTLRKESHGILATSEINSNSSTFGSKFKISEQQSELIGIDNNRDKNSEIGIDYNNKTDSRKSTPETIPDDGVYREHSALLKKIFKNYDSRIRPFFRGPPVIVNCDMYVESIDSVDATTMSYGLLLFMRQRWRDPRLAYEKYESIYNDSVINLHPKFLKKLWVPDLFFPNEKTSKFHIITTENKLVRLFPNGDIWYSVRISMTLQVAMHLEDFPLDQQICTAQLESYAFTTNDVIFRWKDDNPVQTNEMLTLPQFSLAKYEFLNCTKQYNTGEYTCIEVRFTLIRQIGYYLIRTFVPTILIVALSWVGFWIHAESAPARVALGITTVLTITTMSTSLGEAVPKVSYVRSIDVWHFVCLIFVFAALIEYAIENFLCSQQYRRLRKKAQHHTKPKEFQGPNENGRYREGGSEYERKSLKNNFNTEYGNGFFDEKHVLDIPELYQKHTSHKGFYYPGKIDKLSQIAFPLAFSVFSIIYFSYYMNRYYDHFAQDYK